MKSDKFGFPDTRRDKSLCFFLSMLFFLELSFKIQRPLDSCAMNKCLMARDKMCLHLIGCKQTSAEGATDKMVSTTKKPSYLLKHLDQN